MEYVLTAEDLCKSYRKCKALNGLSMHVPKGAIYGVIGRNGAGKTTLLRLLCGMQYPTSGEYTLFGKKGTDKEIVMSRRKMGAVVEKPSIYLSMTAAENLEQQYRVLGLPSFEGIRELLELVGLADTGKKKVKHFSLGMKQRLGIAVALCGNPEFLVLDEPANGLDPQGIMEIRELILKLNRENQITFLISSHILEELAKFATHYGFVEGGQMVRELSAEELEASCRKCMHVEVSDTRALARVLDAKGIEYSILSEREAEIFAQLDVTELVALLTKEGCTLYSMAEKEESLESFYISLVGGGNHA